MSKRWSSSSQVPACAWEVLLFGTSTGARIFSVLSKEDERSVNTIKDHEVRAEMGMTKISLHWELGRGIKRVFAMQGHAVRSLLRFDVFCNPGWRWFA